MFPYKGRYPISGNTRSNRLSWPSLSCDQYENNVISSYIQILILRRYVTFYRKMKTSQDVNVKGQVRLYLNFDANVFRSFNFPIECHKTIIGVFYTEKVEKRFGYSWPGFLLLYFNWDYYVLERHCNWPLTLPRLNNPGQLWTIFWLACKNMSFVKRDTVKRNHLIEEITHGKKN